MSNLTIKDKIGFNMDGTSSKELKLLNASMDSGFFEEAIMASRSIVEEKNNRSGRTFFNRIETEPLTVPFTLALDGALTDAELEKALDILIQDEYKPLYFEGKESKIYMVIAEGEPVFHHMGTNEGYFTLNMRCDGDMIYSQPVFEDYTITTEKEIEIDNDGDKEVSLEFVFKASEDGELKVLREGYTVQITKLKTGESILVDSDLNKIVSDLIGQPNKYDDITGDIDKLNIQKGKQKYKFIGNGILKLAYQKKYKY